MINNNKPKLTIALLSYNQDRYIHEAVQGVLAQTYEPLEIIISDDSSSDKTFDIIHDLSLKSKRNVIINQNDINLGIGQHINKVVSLSSGELIIFAAGDDVSLPRRVELLYNMWAEGGRTSDVLCSARMDVSEDGSEVLNQAGFDLPGITAQKLARDKRFASGCVAGYTRRLFDKTGPLVKGLVNEDVALSFRGAMYGGFEYLDIPLVRYRVHTSSWLEKNGNFGKLMTRISEMDIIVCHQAMVDAINAKRWDLVPILEKRKNAAMGIVSLSNQNSSLSRVVHSFLSGMNFRTYIGVLKSLRFKKL